MKSLREARDTGKLAEFAKERRHHSKHDAVAFNATLEAMAGKSKSVPAASSKRNPDD